jgi:sugar lactone lactonase YvrE
MKRYNNVLAALVFAPLAGVAVSACGSSECEPSSGVMCTIAGTGIKGHNGDGNHPLDTDLDLPVNMTVGPDGNLYFLDWNNHAVRVVRDGVVETIAGTLGQIGDAPEGPALETRLNHPTHLTFDTDGTLIVSAWHNSMVMRYDPDTGLIERMCGTGARSFNGDGQPALETDLDLPVATVLMPDGSHVISDTANQRVRRVTLDGTVETIAGTGEAGYSGDGGPAAEAELNLPISQRAPPAGGIAVDADGNLYLSDSLNHVIRKIDTEGVITTIAGTGEQGVGAASGDALDIALNFPADVAVDEQGNVYVADTQSSCVRVVRPDGSIDTFAGICGDRGDLGDGLLATESLLNRPYGVNLGPDGVVYIADTQNFLIRAVYP